MTDVESPSYMAQEGQNCCENCRFWRKNDHPMGDEGHCRRHAPRESHSFPCVWADSWCGEWESA